MDAMNPIELDNSALSSTVAFTGRLACMTRAEAFELVVGWGGGPSDFIGKDTGGGSFPETFKSSLARDFEFHSSADGFAATRTASCRAGRRILGGIDAQHAPSGVHQHSHWPLAFQHGGANARHGQLWASALLSARASRWWILGSSMALAEELVEWLSQKAS